MSTSLSKEVVLITDLRADLQYVFVKGDCIEAGLEEEYFGTNLYGKHQG